MMSITEYAKSRGVSREAVRKQIVRYQDKLERHITTQNRTRYLDDIAQAFLDEHRMQRTVIYEPNDAETEAELQRLRAEVDRLRGELVKKQEDIITLQKDKMDLLETKGRYDALIEDKSKMQSDLETVQKNLQATQSDLQEAKKQITDLQEEAGSYTKTFLGLYRKQNRTRYTAPEPPQTELNE